MERKNKKIVAGMMAGFCVLSTQTLVQYGLLVGNGGITAKHSSSLQAFGTSNKNALEDQHQEELDASGEENEDIVELEKKLDDLKIKDDDDDDYENESDASREDKVEEKGENVGILYYNLGYNNIYDGCQYELDNKKKEATLKECIHKDITYIKIPEYVQGEDDTKYRVTRMYDGAFTFCYCLDKVILSKFVESVGENTFWCCAGLTEILFGEKVKSVGKNALGDCWNLKTVTLLGKETKLDNEVFVRCDSLKRINIIKGAKCKGTLIKMGLGDKIVELDDIVDIHR